MPAYSEQSGHPPRGRRARPWRRTGAAVGVALALGLAVTGCRVGGGSSGPAAAPLPAETARPSTAPPEELFPDRPTLKEPFRGSPAERWADGAAGIELPKAKAVGGMSEKQVAHALSNTRELLIAANLDPATLRGERPKKVFDILEPRQKDVHGMLGDALREPGKDQDPLWMFTRFDPDEIRLVGDVVRTRGRMTFEKSDRGDGEVLVKADYSFVYPVVKAKPGSKEVTRTIIRRILTVALSDPSKWQATPGRLAVVEYNQEISNSRCFVYDGFLHPEFDSDLWGEPTAGATPSGPAVDPYDRSKDVEAEEEGCGSVSRT